MMALAGVELETLVSEPDALTTRFNYMINTFAATLFSRIYVECQAVFLQVSSTSSCGVFPTSL